MPNLAVCGIYKKRVGCSKYESKCVTNEKFNDKQSRDTLGTPYNCLHISSLEFLGGMLTKLSNV